MATIKARRQGDGVIRYTAIVRIRRGGKILHRESRTFAHRTAALSWAKHREVELENPGALTGVQQVAARSAVQRVPRFGAGASSGDSSCLIRSTSL